MSPPNGSPSRSYPATLTASWTRPMAVLGAWYFALVGFGWLVGFQEHAEIFSVVGAVSAIATSVVMMKLSAGRAGAVVVSHGAVTLGSRSVGRPGLRVSVLSWKQQHLWTVLGTALELEGPLGRLRIGGTGHLPPRRSLPVTTRVDASLSAADFLQLARELDVERDLVATGASDVTEIELAPGRTGVAGAFRVMGPWFGTMGLAMGVGVLGSVLGLDESETGQVVVGILAAIVVVGGLVVTIRKSMRPPVVRYRLVVGRGGVRVVDTRSEVGGLSSPVAPHAVHRVTYRYATRGGTFEFPALRLDFEGPKARSMVVGVWDPALVWSAPAERTRRLDYLMGPEEWRLVVEAAGFDAARG